MSGIETQPNVVSALRVAIDVLIKHNKSVNLYRTYSELQKIPFVPDSSYYETLLTLNTISERSKLCEKHVCVSLLDR